MRTKELFAIEEYPLRNAVMGSACENVAYSAAPTGRVKAGFGLPPSGIATKILNGETWKLENEAVPQGFDTPGTVSAF